MSQPSQVQNYELVLDNDRMHEIAASIAASQRSHALDFETTALSPDDGEVRVTSICGPVGSFVIDHFFAGSFTEIADTLADAAPWFVFNAGFEGRWFDASTSHPRVQLLDVGLMSKAKLGGRPLSLKQQIERDLGVVISKEQQNSNWSVAGSLEPEQLDYAFADAFYTAKLADFWLEELTDEQWRGFNVLNDVWRANSEMEDTGIGLDAEYHRKLIRMWTLRREAAEKAIRRFTGTDVLSNIRSKQQVGAIIAASLDAKSLAAWPKTTKTGQLQIDKTILRQASFRAPYPFSRWLAALMVFSRADKYLSTYGEPLLVRHNMAPDGRIRCRLNIAQAVTGRYSSSSPNLQNIPRSPVVRRAFVAPEGAILIVADYSGIELRVLAEMSGDALLKQDVIYGNVHAESAITLFGWDRDAFYAALKRGDAKAKELRSRAKAFSFQLTYGAGPAALAVVLRCTDEEAAAYIDKWAARYPKAYAFRTYMFEKMNSTGFLPCQSGRTIYVPRTDRSLPVASNYPIQGSAGDVMYRAIYYVHQRMLAAPGDLGAARMCLTVHDELLIVVRDTPKFRAYWQQQLEEGMKEAWLDIFPNTSVDNLVEAGVGKSWADKK